MSDADLRAALECMEAWLADPAAMPAPEALEDWNRRFREALADAERGRDWEELVSRARSLAPRLEARTAALIAEREVLRREMDTQVRGDRALKGYGASVR